MAKDVEIVVVGPNFVEGIVRAVPLVEDLLYQVFMAIKAKANGPLVRLSARVAIDFQLHELSLAQPEARATQWNSTQASEWFRRITPSLLSSVQPNELSSFHSCASWQQDSCRADRAWLGHWASF